MTIKPKWVRDIASCFCSLYYVFYANEAEEKLRKFRALSTVEFLRATWEKQANPYLRFLTIPARPSIKLERKLLLARPHGSPYTKSISAFLYYDGPESSLARCKDLILDFSGGGFICMSPLHHEDRIKRWAKSTGKPILSVDYCKAPEFPYPFAIHEGLDVYRLLVESCGRVIGFASNHINIVMTGDSAGANIVAAVVLKILEMPAVIRPPLPVSVIFAYPALDFNFQSWMSPTHLSVLRHESMANLKGIVEQKDHFSHRSPLAVQDDRQRKASWRKSFSRLPSFRANRSDGSRTPKAEVSDLPMRRERESSVATMTAMRTTPTTPTLKPLESPETSDSESEAENLREDQKPIGSRVKYWEEADKKEAVASSRAVHRMGTRLTMTSRSACFNDRILNAPMMRSMALCYIGPRNSPDISTNYYISPILAPDHLLALFPPVFLVCGEKDPLSDDTIVFAGRLRDAKNARKREALSKSGNSQFDDPIVEESEEDWVHMRIIEGWSHGFLQMVTLLPAAEGPIQMMADWIKDSFHIQHIRLQQSHYPRISAPVTPAEEKEEILSFATKRRNMNGTRVGSPAPSRDSSSNAASNSNLSQGNTSTSGLSTPNATDDPKTRRLSEGKSAPFVDASAILQRRREDVVFGLKESAISLTSVDEDLEGQEAAERLSEYAS